MVYEKAATLRAIDAYVEARQLWQDLGDYESAAIAAKRLGAAYEQLGELDLAAENYDEALALAQQSSDERLEAELQGTLGMVKALQGGDEAAWKGAEAHCQAALALADEMGSDEERARALNCFGEASYARGKTREALSQYEKAASILRQTGDRASLAQTLLFLGYSHADLGSFEMAEANYDEALAIWQSIGNRRGAALALAAIARTQYRRSQYQLSLNHFYAAQELFEKMGDTIDLASSYDGIASVYIDIGQYQNAAHFWNLALRAFEEAELYYYVPDVLEDLGLAKLALGDRESALTHFNRASTLSMNSGNTLNHAYALRLLGYTNFAFDRPKMALEYLLQLLELNKTIQNPRLEADTFSDIGFVYSVLGEPQKATDYLQRALRRYEGAANRTGQARALFGLAKTHDGLGNLELARHYLETTLEVTDSLRAEVVRHDMRASYVASVHEYYRLYVDLLMRAHQERPGDGLDRAAFQASERARARSLLENLAATGVNLREGVDEHLIADEEQLRRLLNEQYQRQAIQSERTEQAADQLASETHDLETKYQQIRAKIHASSPRYAALTSPQPLTLGDVQSQILDDDTTLLEYSLGEERSYLWVVSSDEFFVYTLPPRDEIDSLAKQTYALITRPAVSRADQERYWNTAARLSEIILGPAMAQLKDRRLIVVADGALRYVPFSALPKSGGQEARPVPMIVDHEIIVLPSASALAVLRNETRDRPRPPRALAMFADPVFSDTDPRLNPSARSAAAAPPNDGRVGHAQASGRDPADRSTDSATAERKLASIASVRGGGANLGRLPHTANEADQITRVVPDGDFLKRVGFDASREAALDPELSNYRIIHFATHAKFNETEPGLSGLIFSQFDDQGHAQDGFVRLHDIYDLRLPAELVVLSACDTALGEEIEGEGIVGIVRGFMYAGSKRVVASFWQVADAATSELMSQFYVEMLTNGLAPSDALRRAQLHIMSQRKWQHPFYWAAFSLQGEWRAD
ncbi:MAG: CHAT domain-containing protein [Deltaproteobacteria bacterium]|nr:CHAT domain-containing protein [Deltaproteobacteria bacterium]MBW2691925.1 CHAT domain-containing protein [Deltaproteobacteria bacterium]